MKKINYIFLFILLGFSAKALALPSNSFAAIKLKENKFEKAVKETKFSKAGQSPKAGKQKRPKKPKGIKVIVPVVSNHVFKSYYIYSDLSVNELKGNYSLLLQYSHGKRGPPSHQA
ncbi:hypothetical protein CNR22_14450 [Sphingobacteriaceae bacterium]|nr:hypothetical protein CNR22_14450 [Sphingobacteriaceae bacterium]